MKDRAGRFVMQNRRAYEGCYETDEAKTLGKTDADYWSADRAAHYMEGDQLVIRTGTPIINQLAPAPEEAGSHKMVIYSKFPVKNSSGEVIGIAGVHHLFDERQASKIAFGSIYKAVRRIHEAYSSNLKVADLAKLSGLSHSQFVRRFKSVLGASPKDYLLRVRLRNACRLLESGQDTIADIAYQCGFYDQSHFSHTFTKQTGLNPTCYRNEHL